MEAVVGGLEHDPRPGLDPMGPRRRRHVVEQRAPPGEPLDPEQLLGVEAAVGRPVLGVARGRDGASRDVVHARLASSGEEASLGRGGGAAASDRYGTRTRGTKLTLASIASNNGPLSPVSRWKT